VSPLDRAREYLDTVAAGLKIAVPAELPMIARQIALEMIEIADEAEARLTQPDEPDED
jgi:hypothetical protein